MRRANSMPAWSNRSTPRLASPSSLRALHSPDHEAGRLAGTGTADFRFQFPQSAVIRRRPYGSVFRSSTSSSGRPQVSQASAQTETPVTVRARELQGPYRRSRRTTACRRSIRTVQNPGYNLRARVRSSPAGTPSAYLVGLRHVPRADDAQLVAPRAECEHIKAVILLPQGESRIAGKRRWVDLFARNS